MHACACISTSSPITTCPDCTIFCQRPCLVFGEAEAIRADHDAVLQDDIVADLAVLPHDRVRVSKEVMADGSRLW